MVCVICVVCGVCTRVQHIVSYIPLLLPTFSILPLLPVLPTPFLPSSFPPPRHLLITYFVDLELLKELYSGGR